MKLFELYGDIVIDDKGAQDKIDGIDKKAGGLGGSFSKLGGAAMLAGGAIATGLGAALVDGVKGMMEAQDATTQLDAVLKSTGGAAGVTKEQAVGLADELERTTKFSYEAALAGQNMLLTFTNIGKDVFPQATQTAADMAQALGTDMAGQAMQLGKALNNPTEGISALTRVGVTFTQAQKDQIAAMQAAGDMAGAQTIILQELQKEFGGSAVAAGQTFSGQLEILKNGLGNLTEGLASGLMPYLQQFVEFLNANMPAIQAVMDTAFKAIGAVVQWAGGIFTQYILPAVQEVGTYFAQELGPVIKEVAAWVQANMPQFKATFEAVFKVIATVVKFAWDIFKQWFSFVMDIAKTIAPILGDISAFFNKAFGEIADFINNVIDDIKSFLSWIDKALKKAKEWLSMGADGGGTYENPAGISRGVVPRANGGSFAANELMLVGEEGPELVQFGKAGNVIPNSALTGGKSTTVGNNVIINVYDGFNGVRREINRLGLIMPTRA